MLLLMIAASSLAVRWEIGTAWKNHVFNSFSRASEITSGETSRKSVFLASFLHSGPFFVPTFDLFLWPDFVGSRVIFTLVCRPYPSAWSSRSLIVSFQPSPQFLPSNNRSACARRCCRRLFLFASITLTCVWRMGMFLHLRRTTLIDILRGAGIWSHHSCSRNKFGVLRWSMFLLFLFRLARGSPSRPFAIMRSTNLEGFERSGRTWHDSVSSGVSSLCLTSLT